MKKTHSILVLVLILLLSASGCRKYLDLPPKNQRTVISAENIESLLASYLRGVTERWIKPIYGQIMPACPAPAVIMFESYSDNIDFEKAFVENYMQPNNRYFTTGREEGYANLLLWNQHATADLIWDHHYEIVGFMNAMIEQMEDIQDLTPIQYHAFLGEMLAHRAYSFYKLLQYYAPYDQAEMGIPMYLHTGSGVVGIKPARSTQAEVYEVILGDLQRALDMVKSSEPISSFSIFYNERWLNHLLAQVYWFKAESAAAESTDYENVILHASAAVQAMDAVIPATADLRRRAYAGQVANYPVVVQENNQQGQVGVIYGTEFQYIGPGTYGPNTIPLSEEFANLFVPTDIRIENYFNMDPERTGGLVGTEGRILNWAWPADGSSIGNFKRGMVCLFKPEEAYLMLAEAQFRQSAPGQAVETLNKFKAFRNAGTVQHTTGEGLLFEIIDERRREFFADSDKRWLDLKRYAYKTIERNLTVFQQNYHIVVEPNSHYYALPIPLSELQANNNIVPNPGWEVLEF